MEEDLYKDMRILAKDSVNKGAAEVKSFCGAWFIYLWGIIQIVPFTFD